MGLVASRNWKALRRLSKESLQGLNRETISKGLVEIRKILLYIGEAGTLVMSW